MKLRFLAAAALLAATTVASAYEPVGDKSAPNGLQKSHLQMSGRNIPARLWNVHSGRTSTVSGSMP